MQHASTLECATGALDEVVAPKPEDVFSTCSGMDIVDFLGMDV